ncbi:MULTISPECIES: hypothetical protein [Paenibacillus]|uniref:hypothetical protein n=1 Tax=Paenibacillus TaxID=44249 RepID=UPI00096D8D0B|nr:hypothetical protein [Paenibacillus odorifer]OME52812.1 hypothetical protein BSK61_18080 [Paenibacillus odorifer]
MKKIHLEFEGQVSTDTFDILGEMYRQCEDTNYFVDEATIKKVFRIEKYFEVQNSDKKLKIIIFYQRYCILIKELLNEYSELAEEDRKKIVDYYLFDNRLKELKYLGLGHYYNAKFKKSQATLYRSKGRDRIESDYFGAPDSVEIVKRIFEQCREHINKGTNKVRLYSYSKCFGTVLFKYLSIEKGKISVNLQIIPKNNINVINVNGENMSVQQFVRHQCKDARIDFCIDMSSVRNGKRDNLTIWMKDFLGESSTEIQRILSPVSDQEVIASCIPNQEISECFNEEELIYLLYRYYKKYYEVRNHSNGEIFKHEFKKAVAYLNEEFEKQLSNQHEEENTQQLKIIKTYIDQFTLCLDGDEAHDKKVDKVFTYIDWSKENLNIEKDAESIYKFKSTNSMITNFKGFLHNYLMKVSEELQWK